MSKGSHCDFILKYIELKSVQVCLQIKMYFNKFKNINIFFYAYLVKIILLEIIHRLLECPKRPALCLERSDWIKLYLGSIMNVSNIQSWQGWTTPVCYFEIFLKKCNFSKCNSNILKFILSQLRLLIFTLILYVIMGKNYFWCCLQTVPLKPLQKRANQEYLFVVFANLYK